MKKVFIGLFVLVVIILALRLLSGPEDTWVKSKTGNWVKHGNPSAPMPTTINKPVTSNKLTPRPTFDKKAMSGFCGVNSYGKCDYDIDCYITGCSSEICQSKNEPAIFSTCIALECHKREEWIMCGCVNNKCQWRNRTIQ